MPLECRAAEWMKMPNANTGLLNRTEQHLVIPIPSLAPPQFNKWSSWSDGYLDKVADRVREKLATR